MARKLSQKKAVEEHEVHEALLNELSEIEATPEEREQMISEAAYYRAQQRGFGAGESEHEK